MNESQIISQLTQGSSAGSGINDALSGLQSQLGLILWLGVAGSVIVTIGFIIYFVMKMRAQAAVIRMDKNLQKLVDALVPEAPKKEPAKEVVEAKEEPVAQDAEEAKEEQERVPESEQENSEQK